MDAQADLEEAILNDTETVLMSVDYRKFFDSFDICDGL